MHRPLFITIVIILTALQVSAKLELSGLTLQKNSVREPVTARLTQQIGSDNTTLSLSLELEMEKHIHIYSAESLFFALRLTDTTAVTGCTITLPSDTIFTNFDGSKVGVYVGGQKILITGTVSSVPWRIGGSLQFQACDSLMCFTPRRIAFFASSEGICSTSVIAGVAPQEGTTTGTNVIPSQNLLEQLGSFSVVGMRGGFLNVAEFGNFLSDPAAHSESSTSLFDNRGVAAIILLILLGGIALNLTPCVLPMIPVTIAVIGAGAQAKSRTRGMLTGALYGAAMALTYGILGLIVVLTGTRFGVINASPLFNMFIAAIFVVMALAMFDIIQIDFTRFRKAGAGSGERGKLLTVFAMGVVASLLAGACVAPVVIAVVLYAGKLYAEGAAAGLMLPFLLGFGMALPWPFAGAGLSLLPKPGKWMVWVKYLFGIFIFAMALYYGVTGFSLLKKTNPSTVAHEITLSDGIKEAAPLWYTNINEAITAAQRENKPLFIDFWATWCKNCKAMDATTFKDSSIIELLDRYIVAKYQAEKPDEKETKAILDHFGIVGLPSYVILSPKR